MILVNCYLGRRPDFSYVVRKMVTHYYEDGELRRALNFARRAAGHELVKRVQMVFQLPTCYKMDYFIVPDSKK